MSQDIKGADIELFERGKEVVSGQPIVPDRLRINGQEVYMPEGATVLVHCNPGESLVVVTLSVIASRVSLHGEVGE